MTRKGPILHPVKEHSRGGVKVRKHEKGKGKHPDKARKTRLTPSSSRPGTGFNVSLFFSNKPTEVVNVGESNYTAGVRAGLVKMITPAIPSRVQIRRRKR